MSHFRIRGYTLLELMVVIVALGILGAIGVPAYTGYAEKARLSKAKTDIAHLAAQIAKFQNSPVNPLGAFPDSLADLNLGSQLTTDPWGNPYQYLDLGPLNGVGGARKDHNNVQLNTDYDLYSFGKDGTTNQTFTSALSLDDIVRGINGSFIGTPAEYARLPSKY